VIAQILKWSMTVTNQTLIHGGDASRWEQVMYAFLAEKERRSGSSRTVQAYSRMLFHFFASLGKTPDQVFSQEVFAYAHSTGFPGRKPSSVTVAARIACLSSFYRFLIRMGLVAANPCDKLERPKPTPAPPRGLAATDIQRLLSVLPDTPVGLRDRAIILTLTITGRRRTEVLGLTVGNLHPGGNEVYYIYRGKGGKHGKREVPQPAFQAIQVALASFGKDLPTMKPEDSLALEQGHQPRHHQRHLLQQLAPLLRRYFNAAGLPPAGVHIFRHSAAKLRRDAGESVEEVSQFLDHGSLAVTSVYLRRLEGDRDTTWQQVAERIGL
jgi:site-specific recombinase XerD